MFLDKRSLKRLTMSNNIDLNQPDQEEDDVEEYELEGNADSSKRIRLSSVSTASPVPESQVSPQREIESSNGQQQQHHDHHHQIVDRLSNRIIEFVTQYTDFPSGDGNGVVLDEFERDRIRLESVERVANMLRTRMKNEVVALDGLMARGDVVALRSALRDAHCKRRLRKQDYFSVFRWFAKKERLSQSPQDVIDCYTMIEEAGLQLPSLEMVNLVVDAYSHSGEFQNAKQVIDEMQSKYGFEPTVDTFAPLLSHMLSSVNDDAGDDGGGSGSSGSYETLVDICDRGVIMPTRFFGEVVELLCEQRRLDLANDIIRRMGSVTKSSADNRHEKYNSAVRVLKYLDEKQYTEQIRLLFESIPTLLCGTTVTNKIMRKYNIEVDSSE